MLKHFFWLLPSLFASPLVWHFSLHWHSCSGKEQWGVAEVYKTIFKCKQRHSQPSSHICLCLQICLLLSFFHTWPKIFTHTHTQILGVVLYPIIPIHTPFQMFNHCRGLWDTVLIGKKKKEQSWADIGCAVDDSDSSLSSSNLSWPWGVVRGRCGKLSACLAQHGAFLLVSQINTYALIA